MSSLDVQLWWDRSIDCAGQVIRPDVREAALHVWKGFRLRVAFLASEPSEAAELMEQTVAQLSRYLDRKSIAVFSRDLEGLIAHSFKRAIRRTVVERKRTLSLESAHVGPRRSAGQNFLREIHVRLELQELVALLSDRTRKLLALRYAGFTWKEISQTTNEPVASLRSSFWRDVDRVKRHLQDSRVRSWV